MQHYVNTKSLRLYPTLFTGWHHTGWLRQRKAVWILKSYSSVVVYNHLMYINMCHANLRAIHHPKDMTTLKKVQSIFAANCGRVVQWLWHALHTEVNKYLFRLSNNENWLGQCDILKFDKVKHLFNFWKKCQFCVDLFKFKFQVIAQITLHCELVMRKCQLLS